MKSLQTTQELVREILISFPEARNSDNYLYYKVLSIIGKRNGVDIENMSVTKFFLNIKDYHVPPFETVRRTRQKIQRSFPELAGTSQVEALRAIREEAFREYAKGAK